MSLMSSIVPDSLKHALATPLLMKSSLDCSVMKNYHPVPNQTFLSKTLERVVASCLWIDFTINNLHGPIQMLIVPATTQRQPSPESRMTS